MNPPGGNPPGSPNGSGGSQAHGIPSPNTTTAHTGTPIQPLVSQSFAATLTNNLYRQIQGTVGRTDTTTPEVSPTPTASRVATHKVPLPSWWWSESPSRGGLYRWKFAPTSQRPERYSGTAESCDNLELGSGEAVNPGGGLLSAQLDRLASPEVSDKVTALQEVKEPGIQQIILAGMFGFIPMLEVVGSMRNRSTVPSISTESTPEAMRERAIGSSSTKRSQLSRPPHRIELEIETVKLMSEKFQRELNSKRKRMGEQVTDKDRATGSHEQLTWEKISKASFPLWYIRRPNGTSIHSAVPWNSYTDMYRAAPPIMRQISGSPLWLAAEEDLGASPERGSHEEWGHQQLEAAFTKEWEGIAPSLHGALTLSQRFSDDRLQPPNPGGLSEGWDDEVWQSHGLTGDLTRDLIAYTNLHPNYQYPMIYTYSVEEEVKTSTVATLMGKRPKTTQTIIRDYEHRVRENSMSKATSPRDCYRGYQYRTKCPNPIDGIILQGAGNNLGILRSVVNINETEQSTTQVELQGTRWARILQQNCMDAIYNHVFLLLGKSGISLPVVQQKRRAELAAGYPAAKRPRQGPTYGQPTVATAPDAQNEANTILTIISLALQWGDTREDRMRVMRGMTQVASAARNGEVRSVNFLQQILKHTASMTSKHKSQNPSLANSLLAFFSLASMAIHHPQVFVECSRLGPEDTQRYLAQLQLALQERQMLPASVSTPTGLQNLSTSSADGVSDPLGFARNVTPTPPGPSKPQQ